MIDPGDDVIRVNLKGTGGLRVLIVHRLTREYAFLDTGHATYPLNTDDRYELLLALEEMKVPGSRPPDLKRLSSTPYSVKGFVLTGRQIEILRLAARGSQSENASRDPKPRFPDEY